jgi:hypothetical protein
LVPCYAPKPDIIRYQSPNLRLNSSEESRMPSKEWFNSNQFVDFDISALKPTVIDVQGV